MSTSTITVEEYTTPSAMTLNPDSTVKEAQDMMDVNKIRHIPIVKDKTVVGLISDRDLKFLNYFDKSYGLPLSNFMVEEVYTVQPTALLHDVAFEMSERKIGSAIVQSEDLSFLGIFTSTDALNALHDYLVSE